MSTKQSRKCTSCKKRIRPGDLACKIPRERVPKNDIEQRIYDKDCEGGMVPLAPWYYCERCGHQGIALIELEYAWSLTDDNMQDMIDEYRVSYQGQEIAC
ncbi:MAG: hypothetical protein KAG66_21595 [Methylococcales bacterium]|nr:hypothetical protein [Methylococcales bacterium]